MANQAKPTFQLQPKTIQLLGKLDPLLDKYGLGNHLAKVALVLDGSGSMEHLITRGEVQELIDRMVPMGLRFDDNAAFDVFVFSNECEYLGEVTPTDFEGFIKRNIRKFPMSGTVYSKAIAEVRKHFFGGSGKRRKPLNPEDNLPVYCLFVTDGANDRHDIDACIEQIRSASYEPIFFQFVALGADYVPGGKVTTTVTKKTGGFFGFGAKTVTEQVMVANDCPREFAFLDQLDENVRDRLVDNAGFFSVKSPESIDAGEMFARMMVEYPDYIHNRVKPVGLIR